MELIQSGEFVFVYTTLPDPQTAEAMARLLVESRLAACCNILPPMLSIYCWKGTIAAESEIAMLIKTRAALAERVVEAARPLHPYTVPCFMTLPIDGVAPAYRAWALAETEGAT